MSLTDDNKIAIFFDEINVTQKSHSPLNFP